MHLDGEKGMRCQGGSEIIKRYFTHVKLEASGLPTVVQEGDFILCSSFS
jgi:hypothetical protein